MRVLFFQELFSVLKILRLLMMAFFFIISTTGLLLFLLLRPFHRNNVYAVAYVYARFARFLGLTIELRSLENIPDQPVVYVGNHQNSYDIFTVANAVRPNTVSVGKKSLKWIPFFGQVYWLSGNILIDRQNKSKAHGTINQAAQKIKDQQISVWLFPEGTRSRGRGLLKFKTGAFYTAAMAGVPILPVAINTTHDNIDLNRWNNGKIIIEYMPPIPVEREDKPYIRQMADSTHELMSAKIQELDSELGYSSAQTETEKVKS